MIVVKLTGMDLILQAFVLGEEGRDLLLQEGLALANVCRRRWRRVGIRVGIVALGPQASFETCALLLQLLLVQLVVGNLIFQLLVLSAVV